MSHLAEDEPLQRVTLLEFLTANDDAALTDYVANMHPADLAAALDHFEDPQSRLRIFCALSHELASEVLRDAGEATRAFLIDELPDTELAAILEHLDTDDATDLIGEVPEERRVMLLQRADPETRRDVAELLTYPADTAGGLMKTEVAAIESGTPVRHLIEHLRKNAEQFHDAWNVFVVDSASRVVGQIPLRALILADERRLVDEIMSTDHVAVSADVDQEEVAHLFEKYDLLSIPVVDTTDRLIGRITIDDIVDVIEEEATEDMLGLAGVRGEAVSADSSASAIRSRLPWLSLNLLTAAVGAVTIAMFEGTIRLAAIAAALMTVVASQGGNAGVQTMTLVVRGLALGELEPDRMSRVVRRELAIALINGIVLGSICGVAVYLWRSDLQLSAVLVAAMIANFLVAALFGSLVPIVLKRLDIDPAVSSSVFVTAGTDILGFFIFLGLLTWAL